MPGILSRYILKEIIQTWLVVTAVLLLILVTNQFAEVLGIAAANKLPKQAVMLVMGLTSLQYLTILIPIGFFLSIMLALGRLYRDSEMAAIMACGVGPFNLYRPIVLVALLLSAFVGWLALFVSPLAVLEVETLKAETKRRADLRMLDTGRFVSFGKYYGDADTVLYAESITEEGVLRNVFVQRRMGKRIEVIIAERAWQSPSSEIDTQVLQFASGRRYEGVPGDPRFRIVQFAEHGIPFVRPSVNPVEDEPETRTVTMLLGSGDPIDIAELQWRASVPISLLVLTVLAVPLSRSSPRQGRYGGLVGGVLVYIIYVNLLGASKVWLAQGSVPAYLGIWWVHAVFLLSGFLLLAGQFGYLRRISLRRSSVAPA
jgi:lipopolysaccharide export system permease protein